MAQASVARRANRPRPPRRPERVTPTWSSAGNIGVNLRSGDLTASGPPGLRPPNTPPDPEHDALREQGRCRPLEAGFRCRHEGRRPGPWTVLCLAEVK